MEKKELRLIYKEKRAWFSKVDIAEFSSEITQLFLSHFPVKGKNISLFLTMETQKEIDTSLLLDELKKDNHIVVSKSNFSNNELELYRYEDPQQIAVSSYGIPEPQYGQIIQPEELDIIIIPLLCVDQNGYRVGYGKGFYDRLMKQTRSDCQFIGLSFFDPIEKIQDVNEFDIPLHDCVTPEKIYHFKHSL